MTKEMKLMELAAMIDSMKVGDVIDFACGTEYEVEYFGGWCGVKRIDVFDQGNPMYIVSHYCGEAEAYLYHINEYDHRIGDFCGKELSWYYLDKSGAYRRKERTQQNWINCCAKMIADYVENWCDGSVPEVFTVEWEDK